MQLPTNGKTPNETENKLKRAPDQNFRNDPNQTHYGKWFEIAVS